MDKKTRSVGQKPMPLAIVQRLMTVDDANNKHIRAFDAERLDAVVGQLRVPVFTRSVDVKDSDLIRSP
jgi:hypothetical protein